MFILEKLREMSFNIASFGKLGEWSGGGILASFFAFPIILIGGALFDFSSSLFYWVLAILAGLSFFVFFFAVNLVSSDKYSSNIVLDKIWGMIITFAFVPLKWKLMVFGFARYGWLSFSRVL